MRPGSKPLDSLIATVADGWSLDWASLEASTGDDQTRSRLRDLRDVAAIAAFHRGSTPTSREQACPEPPTLNDATPRWQPEVEVAKKQTRRWGRFLLLRQLGQGAYGEVHLALDTELDRQVALKLIRSSRSCPELARQLLDEARMLARVRHPNVASVYGAGEHEGRAGFWMELVDGVTFEEMLRMRGCWSASEATVAGRDLCRALAAVHGAGLVHGDVKTSNIMREVNGRIVLMDFGAGGRRAGASRRVVMGTPLFAAPEVLSGSPASVQSDIYSLGVVLFRLVTSAYPRSVTCVGGLIQPPNLGRSCSLRDLRPELPEAFISVVERALSCDPAERPQTAGSLEAALGVVIGVPIS